MAAIGIGIGLGIRRMGANSAVAQALFARGTFSDARKAQINRACLTAAPALANLDFWHMLNAEDETQAALNFVQNSYNLTKVSTPAFTAGKGYQGNGSSHALATGFTPSTASGKMAQNSASVGVLIQDFSDSSVKIELGAQNTSNTYIGSNGVSLPFTSVNVSSGFNVTGLNNMPLIGLITLVRRDASTTEVFCGKLSLGTFSSPVTALANGQIYYLSRGSSLWSNRMVSAAYGGSATSADQVEALAAAVHADMVATGGYKITSQIAAYGNSLTFGTGSATPATDSWVAQLQADYTASVLPYWVSNCGIPSITTPMINSRLDTGNDYRVAAQFPATKRIAVLWELRNDIANGATTVQAVDNYVTAVTKLKSFGFGKVLVANMIADGTGTTSPAQRTAVNAELASRWSSFADGLVDLSARSELSNANDTTYYNADKLHLVAAGYAIVKAEMKTAIAAALA